MLTITLTRKELERHDACSDGLDLFDALKSWQDDVRAARALKPRRGLRLEWTLLHQVWLAATYPSHARWLQETGIIPPVHGRRANLAGANLAGANLRGANLAGANLTGANLDGADLTGATVAKNFEAPKGWEIYTAACGCCACIRRAQ